MSNTSSNHITIRDAKVEDAPLLAGAERLIAETPGLLASRPHELKDEAFRNKIEHLSKISNGKYIVSEFNGRVSGHALLDPMGLEAIKHVVRLTIAVHPGFQGQGIGEAMLTHLIQWAKTVPDIEKIELNVRTINPRAISLYEKLGFEVEGRIRNRMRFSNGTYADDLEMGLFVKAAKRFASVISDDTHLRLETTRLILEPTLESHAELMFPILQDDSLYFFIPQNPPTLDELKNRYKIWSRRMSPDGSEVWLNWVARHRSNGECVGQFQAGFDEKNGFSVAYTIAKPHQRQGYASEGLEHIIQFLHAKMNVQSIKAWVDTRNEPSICLMKRLGFKQVDFIQDADEFKGTKSDEFVFELVQPSAPAFKKEYYAVIFSSQRNSAEAHEYERMANRMLELAKNQEGFLGVESSRGTDGSGITISYWKTEDSILRWKSHSEHLIAQKLGKSKWYQSFKTRICKVEREYEFRGKSDEG